MLSFLISLFYIYLILSLFAAALVEIIAGIFNLRGHYLTTALAKMLHGGVKGQYRALAGKVQISDPIQKVLTKDQVKTSVLSIFRKTPSYTDAGNFRQYIIEELKLAGSFSNAPGHFIKNIRAQIQGGNIDPFLKEKLTAILDEIELEGLEKGAEVFDSFKAKLENWFDQTMDRASGWYKRNIQVLLFAAGLAIAIGTDADTFQIAKTLQQDPDQTEAFANGIIDKFDQLQEEIRDSLNNEAFADQVDSLVNVEDTVVTNQVFQAFAESVVRQRVDSISTLLDLENQLKDWKEELTQQAEENSIWSFSLGRTSPRLAKVAEDPYSGIKKILGWIITAIAVSFGAPFWFDLLTQVIKVRVRFAGNRPAAVSETQ